MEPDSEQAVVDRIVDGAHAVLLVGDEETEEVVGAGLLPEGAGEGTWLRVSRDETGGIEALEVDDEATGEAAERIESKLDQLRRRGRRLKPDN